METINLFRVDGVDIDTSIAILSYFTSQFIELQATEENKKMGGCSFGVKFQGINYHIIYYFDTKKIVITPEEKIQQMSKIIN